MVRTTVLPLVTVLSLVHSAASAQLLQDPASVLPTSPTLVNGLLTIGNNVFQPDDAMTQEELPGLGHKFELFGAMVKDTDPENATGNPGHSGGGAGGNEVISSTMTPTTVALAYRKLGAGIKIAALTNQIGLKYYFVAPRSCAGGSPRVTLLIDSDSDGDTDFAAHGHVNPPIYAACVTDQWKYEDLADNLPRWEVTPGGAVPGIPVFPFTPWKAFAAAVTAAFPNHTVTAGFLVDDSCSFSAAGCGKAYYDLLTIENRTLEIWQDAVKK
jgi:hypothetical protein